jgi:hypothetical protein
VPLVQDWYRDAANNSHSAVLNGAVVSGGALILSLGTGYKVESGYLALDAASGSTLWVARTTEQDTLRMASSPRLSEDGTVFGSQTLGDSTEFLSFNGEHSPTIFFSGPMNQVSTVLAAPGPVLFASVSSTDPLDRVHPEVRCQKDGALIARFETTVFFYAAGPGSAWLIDRSGALSRYDVRTGRLTARVQASLTLPVAMSPAGILWVEQTFDFPRGTSSSREQGPPTLHVLSANGHEVRRRALPLENEAYDGVNAAFFGDRILLEGEVLPSAGANGVIRAIDLPGWSTGRIEP